MNFSGNVFITSDANECIVDILTLYASSPIKLINLSLIATTHASVKVVINIF